MKREIPTVVIEAEGSFWYRYSVYLSWPESLLRSDPVPCLTVRGAMFRGERMRRSEIRKQERREKRAARMEERNG